MKCEWCEQEGAVEVKKDCTWIEPAGKATVVVEQVPAIDCSICQDIYITDELTEEVEEALNSVDLEELGEAFSYEELMNAPRLSIFDLYKKESEHKGHSRASGACKF
ncbi:YokU family protein [Bacillus horti]|uniref:YokU family protein n=1 Tax=Caldalkalibacillus horti TaxID=77523 RepID=A0ABT9W1Y5_9BACI|nr:YokU family protein [Bacillus horti]MDQ0167231.1 putative YokU family protein [Bacillus horti]